MLRTMALVLEKNLAENGLAELGFAANHFAAENVFADYRERRAINTRRRQDADLTLFAKFLNQAGAGVNPEELSSKPESWRGVTWGLVAAFMRWMLGKGYAVSSANIRLSTVKTYAKLALKAGAITPEDYALISAVEGYSRKEVKRIDSQRESMDLPTRIGDKKSEAVSLTVEQAAKLKTQPDTPQGRRDALIMCLLLEHGLRVGEIAGLKVGDFSLKSKRIRFYRQKVNKTQTHKLTNDTFSAAKAYFENDSLPSGALLRGSRKDRSLTDAGMITRAITKRVEMLGKSIGIDGLSAHDCRHYWATQAARNGTPIDRLQDAGGWSSPVMPLRYIEATKIANQGVRLR